ncbi:MAG TPA: hypothetical protein VIT85_01660 [Solirubrobacterales bacterium]
MAALALVLGLAACGGGSSSDSDEPEGKFEVDVVKSEFPAEQQVGQTSLMKLAVRNTGDRAIPGLTVTVSVAGEEGETSSLPFGVHDPQPELSQPDRPVWVLEEGYPHVGSSDERGGSKTSSPKTFDFGELDPGQTVEGVWKLSAVRVGEFDVTYLVGAGLGGKAKAEAAGGEAERGSFPVKISDASVDVEVTDSGEIVEIGKNGKAAKSGN